MAFSLIKIQSRILRSSCIHQLAKYSSDVESTSAQDIFKPVKFTFKNDLSDIDYGEQNTSKLPVSVLDRDILREVKTKMAVSTPMGFDGLQPRNMTAFQTARRARMNNSHQDTILNYRRKKTLEALQEKKSSFNVTTPNTPLPYRYTLESARFQGISDDPELTDTRRLEVEKYFVAHSDLQPRNLTKFGPPETLDFETENDVKYPGLIFAYNLKMDRNKGFEEQEQEQEQKQEQEDTKKE